MTDDETNLFHVIYKNDKAYSLLTDFYLDWLSEPYFQIELEEETKINHNERWNISKHIAAWLPFEKNYKAVMKEIEKLAGVDIE